jgi:putative FmdB family regulatory protein
MPTYVYHCELHGEFEEIHSMSEQLEECPKCKEEGLVPKKVTRLIASNGAFILTGGGWAREGYS